MLASCLLAFVMVFATACNDNKGSVRRAPEVPEKSASELGVTEGTEDTKSLLGIEVTTLPKTQYNLDETFTSDGMQVRATFLDSTIEPDPLNPNANLINQVINASDYTVDSNDFNNKRVGVYTIYVSYTYLGVTRTASYDVTVNGADPAFGGIVVELASGKNDTYTLSDSNVSATISDDLVDVYAVGADGEAESTPLTAGTDYEVQLYLGAKEIENNVATENGVYSLVASLKDDATKQDFIPVYVANPVASISRVESVGSTTQGVGPKDKISSTWQFTVTYANGVEKTVKAGSAGLTIPALTVGTVGTRPVTVTYKETDALGTQHTVTCSVSYEITDGELFETVTIGFDALAPESGEETITEEVRVTVANAPSYISDIKLLAGSSDDKQDIRLRSNTASVNGTSRHAVRTNGTSGKGYRNIAFTLGEGTFEIVVYARSVNSEDRYVQYWTEESEVPVLADNPVPYSNESITTDNAITFEVEGGTTFYFGSVGSIDIFLIVITQVA